MNKHLIIKQDEFQKYTETPEGTAKIINKYKDEILEINLYIVEEGKSFYLKPPKSKDSVKTYFVVEGELYSIETKEYYKKGSIVVLNHEHEFLNITSIKKTQLLVHSVNDDSYERTENTFQEIYRTLIKIQNKDAYTHDHSMRVYELVRKMAIELDYSGQRLQRLLWAAKYHDIGKIYIDDKILNKPGKLTEEEYEIMKGHAVEGKDLILNNFNQETYDIICQHHERLDGSGYPKGLMGDEISEEGKILAICDTFDAMTTNRVYKKGEMIDIALETLQELAGTKYDKDLVDLFVEIILIKEHSQ